MKMKGTYMPKCHKCQEMKAVQGWDDNRSKPRWTVVQDIVQVYLASKIDEVAEKSPQQQLKVTQQ
jgi:hypothetical protein